jgi:GGDEF domain-containing protein
MDSQGAQFGKEWEANLRQILNKDLFLFLLDHEVKRARRYQNFISILLMKLVPFSHENNGKHFEACQQMLCTVLMEEMRETDILGSLGENKWVALLPYADVSAGDQARIRFENMLKYHDFNNKGFQVRVQQFCFPRNGTNTPDLIRRALDVEGLSAF